jgi:hypothetical protein
MEEKHTWWQQDLILVSWVRYTTKVLVNVSVSRQYLDLRLQTTAHWKTMVGDLVKIVRNAQSQIRALKSDQITVEISPIESKCFFDCIQLIDSVLSKLPVNGFL